MSNRTPSTGEIQVWYIPARWESDGGWYDLDEYELEESSNA